MNKNYSNMNDEQLFSLMKKGKKEAKRAFEEVYNRYGDNIYNYCRKILKNKNATDDVFQDTFIKFYESIKSIQSTGALKGYLFKIARNLCLNENAKFNNNSVQMDEDFFSFSDDNFESLDMSEILHKTVEIMPDAYKEVIVLKEFMDYSYDEISNVLGISASVIRMRLHRARKHLKEMMMSYVEEFNNIEKN